MAKKKAKRRSKSRSNSLDAVAALAAVEGGTAVASAKPQSNATTPQRPKPAGAPAQKQNYPQEEDLSLQRHDEETVLSAIYGDDFALEAGAWNCPLYKLRIRPASDVTDHGNGRAAAPASSALEPHQVPNPHDPHNGRGEAACELTLHIQLNRKYPFSVPMLKITDAVGVSNERTAELQQLLQAKASECAQRGEVMGWELGQVVEAFLVDVVERRKAEEKKRQDMLKRLGDGKKRGIEDSLNLEDESYVPGDEVDGDDNVSTPANMVDVDTERELARQMEALDAADQMRKQRRQRAGGALSTVENEDAGEGEGGEEDDILQQLPGYDADFDLPPAAFVTTDGDARESSRYQMDFVETAKLGQGGGGEVVQAINRLDRRVYAIKKIALEPEIDAGEDGKDRMRTARSKLAAIQNEKLRREVTTISMLSHKNIVRYYQAWLETPERHPEEEYAEEEVGEEMEEKDAQGDDWDSSSSSGESDSSESADDSRQNGRQAELAYSRSLSLDNFLEQVGTPDLGNPLMLGTQLPGHPEVPSSSGGGGLSGWTDDSGRPKNECSMLYIQMEWCETTMRDMIDESKLSLDFVWRALRQILEALVYIHCKNVIHRDLKPANIFFDSEQNVQLGDFGLATSNRSASKLQGSEAQSIPESEADALYEAIDDISGLLGPSSSANLSSNNPVSMSSITGGVGTAFYMAPEQEKARHLRSKEGSSYDSKADMYSLGILLFEMFNLQPLGSTYMERAETLQRLRGEKRGGMSNEDEMGALFSERGEIVGDWEHAAERRFPQSFREAVPLNAQKIILWLLERSPKRRPSAKQLLASDLLPRKVEIERVYLDEVLQTLSKGANQQIVNALFERKNPAHVMTTYDSEVSLKAKRLDGQRLLAKSLNEVKGSHWGAHQTSYCNTMSATSVAAAISALRRARQVGSVSGGGRDGEALRGSPQQTATILSMAAASAAAVEGSADGVLGADPRVVHNLCCRLSEIFESHGAVRLQGPLLRPRDSNHPSSSLNKPVELLSQRGAVLNLREDLVANFARAVSRGGSSASNMKRYDINKVYLESDAGLHPREMLESSFDIVANEHTAAPELLEAESILVLCRAMSLLAPKEDRSFAFPPIVLHSPLWYLRLTHTRLSDAIMDLLFVPTSEAVRQTCLDLFTAITACPPNDLCNNRRHSGKQKGKAREVKAQRAELLEKMLAAAVANGLPKRSARRLNTFLRSFLTPHVDATKALDAMYEAMKKLHHGDVNSSGGDEIKRLSKSCFMEAIRCINELRGLLKALSTLGIATASDLSATKYNDNHFGGNLSHPAYISIDLGLRQKRQHYSGGMLFQAVLLKDDFFAGEGERSANKLSPVGGKGTRVAEGGRYDDLVRSFSSIQVGNFSGPAARVPRCVGMTFFLGRLVERIYSDAMSDEKSQNHSFVESLRHSLGHPLLDSSHPVQCIVASESGLDLATCTERARISSLLWQAGISCEYLAQSGVMLSLLRHWGDTNAVNEWSSSVDRISGICALLNIPFVVVVQPHLLKSKAAVKLRQTTVNSASGPVYNESEELVPLTSLPSLLLERLNTLNDQNEDTHLSELPSQTSFSGEQSHLQVQQLSNTDMECIYVSADGYFDNEHRVQSTQWKQIKKLLRQSSQKMAGHIGEVIEQHTPVLAIDLPFRVVRDVGSALTFDGVESLSGGEMASRYPEHKKKLRSLAYALDQLARKGQKETRLFLYSIPDDRYDLVTTK
ncbi:hypothetical protein ACHAXT_002014 [Thalassiosira profunda]